MMYTAQLFGRYQIDHLSMSDGYPLHNGLASRDLMELVRTGFLVPVGERKGRYYTAAPLSVKAEATPSIS
jgi:hypothetical protein